MDPDHHPRYLGVMAIRYKFRGGTLEADTPKEMSAILSELQQAGLLQADTAVAAAEVPEEAQEADPLELPWGDLTNRLYGPQRKLAEYMIECGDNPVSLEEIAGVLGFDDTRQAGGIVSAVRKNAKSAGLEPDQVMGRLRDGRYAAGRLLLDRKLPPKSRYDRLMEDDEATE